MQETSSIPGWRRSPGEGNGNPLQYSCLGNPMDRGAWWARVVHALATKQQQKLLKYFNWFYISVQFSSVQLLSHVWLFATPWISACQASLSITNSQSSLKLMSIESVMPSSHLILLSPSPPAPNPSQHQGLFQWVSSLHEVAKVLEFQLQHQSFQWTPRTDLL